MNARPAIPVIFRPVREGDVDEAARLLDAEPHLLEARDSWWNYCTPIMIAAEEGHVGVVRLLLERGADVNASNKDSHPTFPFLAGCTALLLGALEGHEEVVSVLLGSGADITRKNRDGGTVLWMACRFASTGVVLELLQHMQGVGLDERDDEGCTALWYACYWGNVEIVRALVLAGADHTIANHRGRTTRGEAEWGEYDECVEVLEWWDGELERAYTLHRARRVQDDSTHRQQAPGAPAPAYLEARMANGGPWPQVQAMPSEREKASVKRPGEEGREDEDRDAMLQYVLHDLGAELYIELMEGFHHAKPGHGQADIEVDSEDEWEWESGSEGEGEEDDA